jgi:polyhydroxyalkanoate synthesis repressor PhaR
MDSEIRDGESPARVPAEEFPLPPARVPAEEFPLPPARVPKVIKRYANRKLYDTAESKYVTLEGIAGMVKQGVEVRIVDNRSKEDLTSVTLAQVILEEERKRSRMPLDVLRDIIRNGGESISAFIQREVQPRVTSLREEAEAGLDRLRRDVPGDKPKELLGALQAMLQEWQGRVEGRLHSGAESVSPVRQIADELQQIAGRLGELEKRIAHLEENGESTSDLPQWGPDDARGSAATSDLPEASVAAGDVAGSPN